MGQERKKDARFQQKHDTQQNWEKAKNFIPKDGEIIVYDADENTKAARMKIGDGVTNVNDLPFSTIGKRTPEGGEVFNDLNNSAGEFAHAEGASTTSEGRASHAEGCETYALGDYSHAEGFDNTVYSNFSHTQGSDNIAGVRGYRVLSVTHNGSDQEDSSTGTLAYVTVADANLPLKARDVYQLRDDETELVVCLDVYSQNSCKLKTFKTGSADENGNSILQLISVNNIGNELTENLPKNLKLRELNVSDADNKLWCPARPDAGESSECCHSAFSTGCFNSAFGRASAAQGCGTTAIGHYSHAEGYHTTTKGHYSHSEGAENTTTGVASHAEGRGNEANGDYSHTEGYLSSANALGSHAEGLGTVAASKYQHVQGIYNAIDENDKYANIIGYGGPQSRANISTVGWDGSGWFKGDVKIGGTGFEDAAAKKLATEEYVKQIIPDLDHIEGGPLEIKQGGTGVNSKQQAALAVGAYPLYKGKQLGASSNLNDLITPDCYFCSNASTSNAIAENSNATVANSHPCPGAQFTMRIFEMTPNYIAQELIEVARGTRHQRIYTVSTGKWGTWNSTVMQDKSGSVNITGEITVGTDKKKLATEDYVNLKISQQCDYIVSRGPTWEKWNSGKFVEWKSFNGEFFSENEQRASTLASANLFYLAALIEPPTVFVTSNITRYCNPVALDITKESIDRIEADINFVHELDENSTINLYIIGKWK